MNPDELAQELRKLNSDIQLAVITNRGVKAWPTGFEETFCTDHWRCRFETDNGHTVNSKRIPELLSKAIDHQINVIKTETLYEFDGHRDCSLGQGQ